MVVEVANTYYNIIYNEKPICYNIWLLLLRIHNIIYSETHICYNIWLLMLQMHIVIYMREEDIYSNI